MIMKVWEVYKRDSQEYRMFLTKELAENQEVFSEVDLMMQAEVYVTYDEYRELMQGKAVQ